MKLIPLLAMHGGRGDSVVLLIVVLVIGLCVCLATLNKN